MKNTLLLALLITTFSCQKGEELTIQSFAGSYQLKNVQIQYLDEELTGLTPLTAKIQDASFTLFNDFTYTVDTSYIDYLFFLHPGKALTHGKFIGIWFLDIKDQILTSSLAQIAFSIARNQFIIYTTSLGRVNLSTETLQENIPNNIQSHLFQQLGEDLGLASQALYQSGSTFDDGLSLGNEYGYYMGYHERYKSNGSTFEIVALDPIDEYAAHYLTQIDTLSNNNTTFLSGFKQGFNSSKELGRSGADKYFTQEAKVLNFEFEFEMIQ